jgi:hypothetical protein
MILSQTTPTRPGSHAARPTPTSSEAEASSPPPSATVLRFRETARKYRAFAETLRLSGDIQGSANAIAQADFQDQKAYRLQYKNTKQRRRRAEKGERKLWAKYRAETNVSNASKPATDIHEHPTHSPQDWPMRADSLEPKGASPDEYREENNASEQTSPTSFVDAVTRVWKSDRLPLRDNTILHSLMTARELRGVATTLQSSGDAEGAAKSTAEAEVEEGKARELLREKRLLEEQRDRTRKPGRGHHEHVLRLLSAALELRDVARESRSSGDTDGAAKAIAEAESKERYFSRLLENRAWKAQRTQIADGSHR